MDEQTFSSIQPYLGQLQQAMAGRYAEQKKKKELEASRSYDLSGSFGSPGGTPFMGTREEMMAENIRQDARLQAENMRRDAKSLANQTRADALAEKRGIADAEIAIPGYNLGQDVRPQKAEVNDLRDAVATAESLGKNVDALSGHIDKSGPFQYFGSEGAEMGQLSTDILMQLKTMQKLGVLSNSDVELLRKQVGDPTSMSAMFTGTDTAQAGLRQLKKQMDEKLAAGMSARGYSNTRSPLVRQPGQTQGKRYQILQVE